MQNCRSSKIGLKWLAPLLVMGPALTCVAPKAMAALFIASAVFAIGADCLKRRALPELDWLLATCLGGIVAYGALSQFWTINPEETLPKAGMLGLLFAVTSMLVPIIRRLEPQELERFGQLVLLGLGLGLAVYGLEQAFGFPLYNLANPHKANAVTDIKQSKAIVLLALWFYLSLPYMQGGAKGLPRAVSVLAGVLLVGFTFTSPSMSAQLYVVAAALWGIVVWLLPSRLALPFATGGVIGFTTLMPVLVQNLERVMDWRHTTSIPRSLHSRIEIWEQAGRRIMEKPLFGWGLDASSRLPNRGEISSIYQDVPQPIAHLHPHNAPIQIWFELGGIGIVLTTLLLLLLHWRIGSLTNDTARRYTTFLLPTVFAYTLTIWGIWQTWFTATLCFVGVAGYAGVRYLEDRCR